MADEKKAVAKGKKANFFVRFGRGFVNFFKKIGLSVTDSHLLLPRKSVTAIMGIQTVPFVEEFDRCAACLARSYCRFRKEGTRCYSKKD